MAVSARREAVRQLQDRGLSERQALKLVGMSTSTLRYAPRDDGNDGLRERLTALAGQHRRHGYRMLHSRLRIDGWAINIKRTYRIYREEGLMVHKRRRKKLPVPERHPLVRPLQPNEVWSMDFVFDELANGRRVKTLTVVDDCSKEVVQIAADTSIPALYVTRLLDQVKVERWLPRVIRTDNGPEFAGRTMQNWAASNRYGPSAPSAAAALPPTDRRDGQVTDHQLCIGVDRLAPLHSLLHVPPASLMRLDVLVCCFAEGQHICGLPGGGCCRRAGFGAPLDGVYAVCEQLPRLLGALAGLPEVEGLQRPKQPHLARTLLNLVPEHPGLRAARATCR